MRAVAVERYGGVEAMQVMDLPVPKVGPDVVLVRTMAAGVNPVDFKIRRGDHDSRFPAHFPLIIGWDVAGIVEAVGIDVTEYAVGDEVVGYVRRDELQWGTYAEFVPAPLRCLAAKPASLPWVQAAALPLAGLTALQALDRGLELKPDDVLLVHAAAGGVGTFAVQLARLRGARVIGTAGESTHPYLSSLGAEPVAYGAGLVERIRRLAPEGVTAVLDAVGGDTLQLSREVLAPGGRVVSIREPEKVRQLGGRYIFVRPDPPGLDQLCRLAAEGTLSVPIQNTFAFEEAAESHRLMEAGHVHGKLVLEVGAGQ